MVGRVGFESTTIGLKVASLGASLYKLAMPAENEILSYFEMCQREGTSLQWGTNFRLAVNSEFGDEFAADSLHRHISQGFRADCALVAKPTDRAVLILVNRSSAVWRAPR